MASRSYRLPQVDEGVCVAVCVQAGDAYEVPRGLPLAPAPPAGSAVECGQPVHTPAPEWWATAAIKACSMPTCTKSCAEPAGASTSTACGVPRLERLCHGCPVCEGLHEDLSCVCMLQPGHRRGQGKLSRTCQAARQWRACTMAVIRPLSSHFRESSRGVSPGTSASGRTGVCTACSGRHCCCCGKCGSGLLRCCLPCLRQYDLLLPPASRCPPGSWRAGQGIIHRPAVSPGSCQIVVQALCLLA